MPFQQEVDEWVLECFGVDVRNDPIERGHRFLEEAIELTQTNGVTREDCHRLVDYVFDRPPGEPFQEVGGVMVCLAALCNAARINLEDASRVELARIWKKIEQIKTKHATKPKASPLPGSAPADDVCNRCGQPQGIGGCDGYCDVPV